MPKRALDEDDGVDGSSSEAASILPEPVVSICSTELGDGRKDDEVDDDDNDGDRSECSAVMESSASDDTSLPTDGSTDTGEPCCTDDCSRRAKNPVKKSVSFDDVTVYYFPRVQGFTCVPSQGGSTLGMGDRHTTVEKYSLSQHADLRRSLHHKVLLEHQRQGRIFLPENFSSELMVSAGEWALDEYYFLQPVPARQRRAMLHDAGIARIDPTEREECRNLRLSRSRCGCSCRDVCRPPSCLCCRSGIGCQVDQMAFPCSCSRNGCANPHGRIEFNAARVRAHFIRTLLQLGLEQNSAAEYDCGLPPPAKRCCFDNDQPTSSSSFPFSLPSSASSLVNSSCVDTSPNALEPPTVYFDSVDRLPGPETMILTYDEDYNEDDDEDSSETSSEGDGSFDGLLDDVHDGETASIMHDSRQRTLDNYVIRFSRAHTYANPGPSHISAGTFPNVLQFGTAAAHLPVNSLQCPLTVNSAADADATTVCKAPHSTSHVYHMTDGIEHGITLPDHCYTQQQQYTLDNCRISVATTTTTTHSYYCTDSTAFEHDDVSDECRSQTTDSCSMPPACVALSDDIQQEAIETSSVEAVYVPSDDSIQKEAKETSSKQAVYVALDNNAHQTAVETNSAQPLYVTSADSVYEETTETDYTQPVYVPSDDSVQQEAEESTVAQPVCVPSDDSMQQEAEESTVAQPVYVPSDDNMHQEAEESTVAQPVYVPSGDSVQQEAEESTVAQPVCVPSGDSVHQEAEESTVAQPVCVPSGDNVQQEAEESTLAQPVYVPSGDSVHHEAVENSLSQTVHITSIVSVQQKAKEASITQPVYVENIQEEAIDISSTQPVSEAVDSSLTCSTRSEPTCVFFPAAGDDTICDWSASVDCVSQGLYMPENTNSHCSHADAIPDFSLAKSCNSLGNFDTYSTELKKTSDLTSDDCTDRQTRFRRVLDDNSLPADDTTFSHTADNVICSNSVSYSAKSSGMNEAFDQVRANSEISSDEKENDVELTESADEVTVTAGHQTEEIDCVDTADTSYTAGQVTVDYCDRTSSDDANVGDL